MGRPGNCGCCCDPCSSSVADTDIPADPHAARTVRLWFDEDATHPFNQEALEHNCSASASVSTVDAERRIVLDVSPSGDRWIGGAEFWDTSGHTYDPSEHGSINSIAATACCRWTRHPDRIEPVDGVPVLLFGPCIEWDGKKYHFWRQSGFPPADFCGHQLLSNASDAASWNGWLHRHPLTSEGWGGFDDPQCVLPDVLTQQSPGRPMGRADDWLVWIDDGSGEWDFDERPDVSFHPTDSKPIDRFGWYIALSSYIPGYNLATGNTEPQQLDVLLRDVGTGYSTWPVRNMGNVVDAPTWPAENDQTVTTLLEDDLTTLPGWLEFPLKRSDASNQPGTSFSGSFTDSPGYVSLVDVGIDDEYPSGCMQAPVITLPKIWGGWGDDDFLRVSWTHRQYEPQHQCEAPDGQTRNNWSSGISLWPFARLTLRRDVANIIDGQNGGSPIEGFSYSDCGTNKLQLSLNTDVQHGDLTGDDYLELPPMFAPALGSDFDGYAYSQQDHWSFLEHVGCGLAQQQYGLSFPSDGDRVEMTVRRRFTEAETAEQLAQFQENYDNNNGQQPAAVAAYPQFRYLVAVQVQGRTGTFFSQHLGGLSYGQWRGWIANASATVRLALVGWAGGGWSDLKVEWGEGA